MNDIIDLYQVKRCSLCGKLILSTQQVHPEAEVHMNCAKAYEGYWNEREAEMQYRAEGQSN